MYSWIYTTHSVEYYTYVCFQYWPYGTGQSIGEPFSGETTSLALSFFPLLILHYVRLRCHGSFPIYYGMTIGITFLRLMFRQSYWWDLWMWLLTLVWDMILTPNSLILWLSPYVAYAKHTVEALDVVHG